MVKKNKPAAALGRKGGKAGTGKAKARTTEQARAAASARWDKRRAEIAACFDSEAKELRERAKALRDKGPHLEKVANECELQARTLAAKSFFTLMGHTQK